MTSNCCRPPCAKRARRLMEAARSGDIEALRPLIGDGRDATQLSLGPPAEDAIAYLRSISGDSHGHEILAILYEVLSAGFCPSAEWRRGRDVCLALFSTSCRSMNWMRASGVELFKLVTAGDYEDMARLWRLSLLPARASCRTAAGRISSAGH